MEEIINAFVVKFSGFNKYSAHREIQNIIDLKVSQKAIKEAIDGLIDKTISLLKILQLHTTKRDMADTLLEGSDQKSRLSTKELLELQREW